MLKLNVVLVLIVLTMTSLSSARLVETSLGPVMGERLATPGLLSWTLAVVTKTILIHTRTSTVDPRYDDAPITFDSFWALPFAAPPVGGYIDIIQQNDDFLKVWLTMIYMKRALDGKYKYYMKLLIWSIAQYIIKVFSSGDLRFSPPMEATPWTETRNATKAKSISKQIFQQQPRTECKQI